MRDERRVPGEREPRRLLGTDVAHVDVLTAGATKDNITHRLLPIVVVATSVSTSPIR